jgi:hypothetical protein
LLFLADARFLRPGGGVAYSRWCAVIAKVESYLRGTECSSTMFLRSAQASVSAESLCRTDMRSRPPALGLTGARGAESPSLRRVSVPLSPTDRHPDGITPSSLLDCAHRRFQRARLECPGRGDVAMMDSFPSCHHV